MAHAIDTRTRNPANALRDNLAEAERLAVNVDPTNVEMLLTLLDTLDQQFDALADSELDLRPETGRWESVQARIHGRPGALVAAGRRAGGWNALRARNAPATNFWWQLDKTLATRRNRLLMRSLLTIGGLIGGVLLLFWTINTLFPPDPQAVLLLNANSQIGDRLAVQDFTGALTVVDEVKTELPDHPELLAWEIALAEQAGDAPRAETVIAQLKALMADEPALFWLTLSERRLAVGDLTGAEEAALAAAELEPDNPRPTYLLANVAEYRGDVGAAIALFDKTYEQAEATAPDLAAIARVRMGTLMQSGAFGAPGALDNAAQTTPTP